MVSYKYKAKKNFVKKFGKISVDFNFLYNFIIQIPKYKYISLKKINPIQRNKIKYNTTIIMTNPKIIH